MCIIQNNHYDKCARQGNDIAGKLQLSEFLKSGKFLTIYDSAFSSMIKGSNEIDGCMRSFIDRVIPICSSLDEIVKKAVKELVGYRVRYQEPLNSHHIEDIMPQIQEVSPSTS